MCEQSVTALPLSGKRVLVTRTREQASVLSERLQSQGAVPVEFPTIHIVPPSNWSQLDALLRLVCTVNAHQHQDLREYGYDWLVFTSANGVNICLERLHTLGYEPGALKNVHIATIGPATAAALARYGVTADLVPNEYIAEGVVAALIQDAQQRGTTLEGTRIALARAAEARKVLVTELQKEGALVDEVAAYYTFAAAHDDERGREVLDLLRRRQLDILTFTSSSTVRNFMEWLRSCEQHMPDFQQDLKDWKDWAAALAHVHIASIGPITSQTARDLGLQVTIEAKEFTIDGLVQAIVQYKGK
jgi:uroporphyrinogen-III synthase